MIALSAHLALQVAILTSTAIPARPYAEAYKRAVKDHRPLLVLVGSEKCPDYQKLKGKVLPSLKTDEAVSKVELAVVVQEKSPKLAKKLLKGNDTTRLILFTRNGDSWQRTELSHPKSPTEVQQFLKRNISTKDANAAETIQYHWGSS